MKHSIRLAAAIAGCVALATATVAVAQQHQPPAARTAAVQPPSKDDVHVHKLYDMTKAAFAPGATVDHEKIMAEVKALSREHAIETGQDPAAMEAHVLAMLSAAMPAVREHPEKIATFDAFWATLHEASGAHHH